MKLTDKRLKEIILETLKEKGAALVSVKAGAKSKDGQAKPNFKKKKTTPPTSASEPFVEKAKENATAKLDKVNSKTAKTSITGKKALNKTTGAHKGDFSKTAPKEAKKDKPIAKPAFELKESYNKEDLVKMIYEQAKKSLK